MTLTLADTQANNLGGCFSRGLVLSVFASATFEESTRLIACFLMKPSIYLPTAVTVQGAGSRADSRKVKKRNKQNKKEI